MSEADDGYLAGIIDGEGAIMANLRSHRGERLVSIEMRLVIANTDERLMAWLQDRYPGNPARPHLAKLRDPTRERPVFYWQRSGWAMVPILRAALPHLVLKRTQALLALHLADTYRNPGRAGLDPSERAFRWGLAGAIGGLNRKGPG